MVDVAAAAGSVEDFHACLAGSRCSPVAVVRNPLTGLGIILLPISKTALTPMTLQRIEKAFGREPFTIAACSAANFHSSPKLPRRPFHEVLTRAMLRSRLTS